MLAFKNSAQHLINWGLQTLLRVLILIIFLTACYNSDFHICHNTIMSFLEFSISECKHVSTHVKLITAVQHASFSIMWDTKRHQIERLFFLRQTNYTTRWDNRAAVFLAANYSHDGIIERRFFFAPAYSHDGMIERLFS